MFDFLEELSFEINFGRRLFAQNEWWVIIQPLRKYCYMVVRYDDILPCPVLFVVQSEGEAKYQEILFRKFQQED